MCPCPFCTTVAILLCPLLLFKRTRNWVRNKLKRHHCACEVCQKAEHERHMIEHTPCHCRACETLAVQPKRRGRPKKATPAVSVQPKRRGRPAKVKSVKPASKRRGRPAKKK